MFVEIPHLKTGLKIAKTPHFAHEPTIPRHGTRRLEGQVSFQVKSLAGKSVFYLKISKKLIKIETIQASRADKKIFKSPLFAHEPTIRRHGTRRLESQVRWNRMPVAGKSTIHRKNSKGETESDMGDL